MHRYSGAPEVRTVVEAIRDQWVIIAALVTLGAMIVWRFWHR
jgi:hypothetical protein